MITKKTSPDYLCPICKLVLCVNTSNEKVVLCENNHHFDIAKEGYLHLLPVQFKHSKNPGDNKAMVNARLDFLEKGYYQPLVDLLTRLYKEYGKTHQAILDAGCGEGFYTHQHKTLDNKAS